METVRLIIEGMTCMGCVNSVKKVLVAIEGVQSVDVSLERAVATVVYDALRANPAQFSAAVEDAGYAAS